MSNKITGLEHRVASLSSLSEPLRTLGYTGVSASMMVAEQSQVAPALKWAGGKRWQVPHLLPLWKGHSRKRLVEPFCGGLAVALGLRPRHALLNDANPHLVNFYRWVERGLVVRVDLSNEEQAYYRNRERFNSLLRTGGAESEEAAALFYYLNRTGYNGLCRFNSSGQFNVPFGRYKAINYARTFEDLRAAMQGWQFSTGDFGNIKLKSSDFVYADPPYDVPFTAYAQGGFSWDDQKRLAERLARHQGPVVLANQATPRIVELYSGLGYKIQLLDAPRRIACNGDRTPAREVLAVRNL